MRRTILLMGVATAVLVAMAIYACGPVGPANILGKDVQALVAEAAVEAGAGNDGVRMVNPNTVPLQMPLAAKRMLKIAFAKVGLMYGEKEIAEQFDLREKPTSRPIHCTVSIRGDHVLAVVLDAPSQEALLSERLFRAIQMRFPEYVVTVRSSV